MKQFFFFTLLFLCSAGLAAQYSYAPLSPKTKVRQQVGNGHVSIEYDRPIARGRKIFGGLVPYDEMWHTGASGTTITFDEPMRVADREVPAGSYALQVFPRKEEWTFVLSTADDGIGRYKPEYDVVNVCVPVKTPGRFYESYSVELDVTTNGATLYVSWTDVQVSVPIVASAEALTLAYIDSLAEAPFTREGEKYFRAANYLIFNQRDLETAVVFLSHMLTLEEEEHIYYLHEMLTNAYQKMGRPAKALASLERWEALAREEFADAPETRGIILERLERKRTELEELE